MRSLFDSPIVRLRVLPDDPAARVGPRPRGSRRPHSDAKVAAVRRLVETTTLTYAEIAARTGVACASICRWTRDGAWQRPLGAPIATDRMPTARASARLKARTLPQRLRALAERYIRELEETPGVDLEKLSAALELLKMAKFAARPKRRRLRAMDDAGHSLEALGEHARAGIIEDLRAAGVKIESAPPAALEDFASSHAPPRDDPALRQRGHRSKRNRDHAWMLER